MLFDAGDFPINSPRSVNLGAERYPLKPCQTVTWISILPSAQFVPGDRKSLPAETPKLPAIIDTGYTGTVALTDTHLDLAGLDESAWNFLSDKPRWVRAPGSKRFVLPVLLADLWLRTESSEGPAHRIALGQFGMELYLSTPLRVGAHVSSGWRAKNEDADLSPRPGPPLPIIGLRAFTFGRVNAAFRSEINNVHVELFVPPFE